MHFIAAGSWLYELTYVDQCVHMYSVSQKKSP